MNSSTTTIRSYLWLMWFLFGIAFSAVGFGSGTLLMLPLLLGAFCLGLSFLTFLLDGINVSKDDIVIRSLLKTTVIPIAQLRRVYQLRKDTLFLVFEYTAEEGTPRTRRVLALPFVPQLRQLRQSLAAANPQIALEV